VLFQGRLHNKLAFRYQQLTLILYIGFLLTI